MPLDIKICGLRTDEALAAALAGGASHIGFIFFEKSPRNVTPQEARRLRKAVHGGAMAVAVTVGADDAALERIITAMSPDMLQLHGRESPERVAEIKARFGLPVMKVLAIREAADLGAAAAYTGIADRLLFDAKAPAGAKLPGGNGIAFDWSLLSGLESGNGYMLSGGINARNVAEALRLASPGGLDVSSGVESAPGVKDASLIEAFFDAVRAAQEHRAA